MSSSEASLLVQEYYKSQQFSSPLTDANAQANIGNDLCGDSIEVLLNIQEGRLVAYSYQGAPAQITKAAAEFIGEFIVSMPITDILKLDANRVRSEGFEVSFRRIRSSISALLAVRNAIHSYLQDGIIDEYEDLIE